MSDFKNRLEEYVDGLLSETECLEIEAALARDGELRAELGRARRFATLLAGMHDPSAEERTIQRIVTAAERLERRRGWRVRITALAAALLFGVGVGFALPPSSEPEGTVKEHPTLGRDATQAIQADWLEFGHRLGEIAAERREGRVPRRGLAGLEVPPAKASGYVFQAALGSLGVKTSSEQMHAASVIVTNFHVRTRDLGRGIRAECERSEIALRTYRKLQVAAGPDVARAFYDIFRPGLADLATARRVDDVQSLGPVVAAQAEPESADRYVRAYEDAVAHMNRRYGVESVALVLGHLAPTDRRRYRRDASQDGVMPDAVLSIRVPCTARRATPEWRGFTSRRIDTRSRSRDISRRPRTRFSSGEPHERAAGRDPDRDRSAPPNSLECSEEWSTAGSAIAGCVSVRWHWGRG